MSSFTSGALSYQGVAFPFGDGTPCPITKFSRGVAPHRSGDRVNPRMDGSRFGIDLKSGPTHELGLLFEGVGASRQDRESDVQDRLEVFADVWSADSLRDRSTEMARLTVGDRAAYGRPREFSPDDSGLWDGVAEIVVKFVAESDLWYGPAVTTTIPFAPVFTGGLPVPAAVPFVLGGGTGTSSRMITVDGVKPAAPVFELSGPIQNPFIEVVGVGRLVFDTTLAHDQVLQVDCRSWAGWTKRNGENFPGALTAKGARLSDMRLPPGDYQVFFGGYDPSGTSSLDVRVEPAFPTFRSGNG